MNGYARAQLEARYQQNNRLWDEAKLPMLIRNTPGWERGFQVLIDWYDGLQGLPTGRDAKPYFDDTWKERVHIFSHILCTLGVTLRSTRESRKKGHG
jgi:hypothetical protein